MDPDTCMEIRCVLMPASFVRVQVARTYSGVNEGREATIFKLLLGKKSLGADITWLSQFAGEAEMLFPPRTHLQVVGEPVLGVDGISVVTLRPTTFQKVRTVEEVEASRKEELKQLASSVAWDLRNEAVRDGAYDSELAHRLDTLEAKLMSEYSGQAPEWYNDNNKYKERFISLLLEKGVVSMAVRDSDSVLSKSLAAMHLSVPATPAAGGTAGASEVTGSAPALQSSSSLVSALHSKFTQDPNFKGFRGKFGTDELFAAGIDAVVGPMDVQYLRAMFNEHCTVKDATAPFTAWNAGHIIETNADREWLFVVGAKGLDQQSWAFDSACAVPEVAEGMMVPGRNAKHLAALLDSPLAKNAGLGDAEVIALRLYTGPMYVKYNAASRGFAAAGSTLFSGTMHVVISGLCKLSRVTMPPPGLIVYRGNGGMALPGDFLEPDEQGFAGGVEYALMSTTPDRSVALGYSGVETGKDLPTIFEIEIGKTSIGADISFLSQFEGEREYLYPPLTHLQIVGMPRLELHNGKQLSIVRMELTVNQRSKTVEQAERSRKDSLGQLASELLSAVRHWVHQNGLLERLGPHIARMRAALQAEVDAAEVRTVNDNSGLVTVFECIINTSEEHRILIAEALWTEGEASQAQGETAAAVALFDQAMDARGAGLCADSKARRDRVIAMRQHLLVARGGGVRKARR